MCSNFHEMTLVKKKTKNVTKAARFNVYLNLDVSNEKFLVENVTAETKIKELKCQVELVAGIPYNIQRLHYLDKADLAEDSDLRQNDVVPGATLDLKLWKMWEHVVRVVVKGDIKETFSLGLTMDKEWEKLKPAFYKHKVEMAKEKLHVALLIAAHRNNTQLVSALLDLGADINYKTSMGRTALHLAASQGNSDCIDMMLEKGACIEMADVLGKTPITTANEWGMKDSERHLFLFQWQTRAAKANTKTKSEVMMHQKFDSTLPTWLQGNYGQIYHANILPPGEFSGSGITAPRRKPVRTRAEQGAPPEGANSRQSGQLSRNTGGIENINQEKEDSMYQFGYMFIYFK